MTYAQLLNTDNVKRLFFIIQATQLKVHVNDVHETVQGKTKKVINNLNEKVIGNRVNTYNGTQEKSTQGSSLITIQESDTTTVQKHYSATHYGRFKKKFGRTQTQINGIATSFRLGVVLW